MRQNYTKLYMSDLISIFKKDIFNLIDTLVDKKIIENIKKESISIDFSSNSREGDISTNILIILLKKKINTIFDLNQYVGNFFFFFFYI